MIDYKIEPEKISIDELNFHKFIKWAEKLCEEGDLNGSFSVLERAEKFLGYANLVEPKQQSFYGKILSQRIICNKHLWQNKRDLKYLKLMSEDVLSGLNLKISKNEKAVFCLRCGDVFAAQDDFDKAEENYQLAYDLVNKGDFAEAEYLGHLAEIKSRNGKNAEALKLFEKALFIMQTQAEIRPFHKLIIESGLYMRLAKCLFATAHYYMAMKFLFRSYKMCLKLKFIHGMPQRLKQFHQNLSGRGA